MSEASDDFYLRYYVGHKGKCGHEFLEFEFRPDGKLRYANNSNYKKDILIRKEVYVNRAVIEELKNAHENNQYASSSGEIITRLFLQNKFQFCIVN